MHGLKDGRTNIIKMRLYIPVQKTQHAKSMFPQIRLTPLIMIQCLRLVMLRPIQFHDELRAVTDKIHNIWADGFLPLELLRAAFQKIIPKVPLLPRHFLPNLFHAGTSE